MLFGSIEYFERDIMSFAKRKSLITLSPNQVMKIHSEIKYELMNDFICDVDLIKECVNNLNLASEKLI